MASVKEVGNPIDEPCQAMSRRRSAGDLQELHSPRLGHNFPSRLCRCYPNSWAIVLNDGQNTLLIRAQPWASDNKRTINVGVRWTPDTTRMEICKGESRTLEQGTRKKEGNRSSDREWICMYEEWASRMRDRGQDTLGEMSLTILRNFPDSLARTLTTYVRLKSVPWVDVGVLACHPAKNTPPVVTPLVVVVSLGVSRYAYVTDKDVTCSFYPDKSFLFFPLR
ncbi:hypothetical protein KQX54_000106, partial [Cotesia glomerata]